MANEDRYYEFDVVVRVRKRIHVSGPGNREDARNITKRFLQDGFNPNIFAKRGDDGHPIEVIIDNDFEIMDPAP